MANRKYEVYEFIKEYYTKNLFVPTYRVIAKGIGMKSIESINRHILNLQKENLVFKEGMHYRLCKKDLLECINNSEIN